MNATNISSAGEPTPTTGQDQAKTSQGKPEHTPGPWKVVNDWNGRPVKIIAPHADPHKPGGIVDITRDRAISLPSSEEGSANARLISAAPDLLDVCKEALQREEDTGESCGSRDFIERLRAAIAKATRR